MPETPRLRRLAPAALTAVLLLAVAACGPEHPNSIFHSRTEFNRDIRTLFNPLFLFGTIVFVLVWALLIWTLIKYRRREGAPEPKHVHGNTTLEILWTVIPALILAFIAVPTVRTIFRTQAKAQANALQVEVIGHQWWWEFRYPQYGIVTANELYLPIGRTVSFSLRTQDVIHSFGIPALAGTRDLVSNHTNFIWFTPDSAGTEALNGFCREYCGASHANMRFKVFTVASGDFEQWARHTASPAVYGATAPQGGVPGSAATGAPTAPPTANTSAANVANAQATAAGTGTPGTVQAPNAVPTGTGTAPGAAPGTAADQHAGHGVSQAGYVSFPKEKLPGHFVPQTPVPAGLAYDETMKGDAARGMALYSRSSCIGCHAIKGNPVSLSNVGPNLTHIGSRTTIAAGQYPNDTKHLAMWIKNSRAMKPGVIMPTLGKGQVDPITKQRVTTGGLDDQQIADIVAYLQSLK